jgi:hypothetical protein
MNKLFVHFFLQNRWKESDVFHNIIKMKELELEQFMLSKEREERVPLVLP